jgi:hypothetical protein
VNAPSSVTVEAIIELVTDLLAETAKAASGAMQPAEAVATIAMPIIEVGLAALVQAARDLAAGKIASEIKDDFDDLLVDALEKAKVGP